MTDQSHSFKGGARLTVFSSTLTLFVLLLTSVASTPTTYAATFPACTAADIVAAEGCPASGLCSITNTFTITDGCILDFGTRDVEITASGQLKIDMAEVTLRAGNFTVAPGGLVDGRTATIGGSFLVETTGNIAVQRASSQSIGTIRVSGFVQGGSIFLDATGDTTIDGQLIAHNRFDAEGAGGDITLLAGGDIVTTPDSEIDAHGGQLSFGGSIEMEAGNSIDIGSPIDNTAEDGGAITITAGVKVTVRDRLNTTGEGDAGSGGDIDVIAGEDVEILGQVQSRGTGSATGSGGGDGGIVFISANSGNITVANEVTVRGGPPDGGGGDIELLARGSIDIETTGQIVTSGSGAESDGGELLLEAGLDLTVDGPIESEGGDSGGDIGFEAGRDIAINALVSAKSNNSASFGGSMTIQAGASTSGNLTLTSTIDASAPGCDAFEFCSLGGDVDATACDITIESLGEIKVDALGVAGGDGGTIFLTARNQMTIMGALDATGAGGPLDGSSTLSHPTDLPPIVTGSVLPAPTYVPLPMCTGGPSDTPFCLDPCPTCGNGTIEFPETCDDTTGTPQSCDGCSVFCQLEDCDDGNACTNDSCDSVVGCIHVSRPNGTSCSDGTICNGEEWCLVGHCIPGKSLDCTDANQCTLDSCDPVTGCHNDPLTGEPCDDGNECTAPDTCNASAACVPGDQLVCDDGNECTVDSCDPGSGCVFDPLSFVPCTDDGGQCTDDVCFIGVCVHPKVSDNTSCSDSDLCDGEETCQNGSCTAGTPVTCSDDGNPCIDDVCDPATGACGIPNTASCDDGTACNGADTCNGMGTCVSEGDQCPTGRACDEITDTCVPTGDVTLIDLGSGECRPGSEVTLDLTLIPADGVAIGVIGADLAYDPEALSFVGVDSGEATSARNGTCSANLGSGATLISCFTEDPDFVTVPYEEGVVAQVTFACEPGLPDEDVVIDNTPAALTATQIPAPVQPVEGADGVIGVLPCTIPGDTNLDCTVNIVELQTCIGMFLDLVPPDSCTDINDNGDIGIVELQSCIAGFLRLLPCP